jgi:hypothetical protein
MERPGRKAVGNALIVSDDEMRRAKWASWLGLEGYVTVTCPGPYQTAACPRLDAELCPLQEWADVAVVDVSPHGDHEVHGGWAERVCTTLPDDGRTIVVGQPHLEQFFGHVRHPLVHPLQQATLVATVRRAVRRT